jgi:oxaloacetate decarboxylase (Na+ extruding) subunit alpha
VLTGERYKSITKETAGILKGEYGSTPSPMNKELQAKVLNGADPITCRPADLLYPEMKRLTEELREIAKTEGIRLESGEREIDDVLTYALFPEIGLKFLKNRDNPDAFEPVPTGEEKISSKPVAKKDGDANVYTVNVNGESFVVQVSEGGDVSGITPTASSPTVSAPASDAQPLNSPLSGNIFKIM